MMALDPTIQPTRDGIALSITGNQHMIPNPEQLKSAVRWFIASPIGVSIISHGWATGSSLEFWGGILISAAPLVWSMFTHTETNAVAVVDEIAKNPESPVKGVLAEDSTAGRALAQAMPGNTTVVVGTGAATQLARAA